MIINEQVRPTKIAKLIGVSRHQLAWRIGWTKINPPVTTVFNKDNAYLRPEYGNIYTSLTGTTCNYARTLHDGRVLESWAYPAEADHISLEWPNGFYYIFLDHFSDPHSDLESADEKLLVQRELVLQMIRVIKYGQDQHRVAQEMLIKIALERLTRPERGLIKLFQTWNK